MKFVFFGNETLKNAGVRYRIAKFVPLLVAEGHRCTVCLPSTAEKRLAWYEDKSVFSKCCYLMSVVCTRISQLRHVPGADAVFFRGPMFPYGPPILERLVRLLNPRMVFDIDDAVWEPPAHVTSPFMRFMDLGWTAKMAGMCKHGIVGNTYLEEHVQQWKVPTTIIPTCIDIERYAEKEYAPVDPDTPVILGWTGIRDNLGYLAPIEPVLQKLAQEFNLELWISSDGHYALDGVHVRNRTWREAEEVDYVREVDIGLMPLHDTSRARGKCAFKALQHMAAAVPVIISPVGMNSEVVQDGVNGLLAGLPEEWEDKLRLLIESPALRERLGRAGRKTVEEQYSFEVNYPKLITVLEKVATE